MSDTPDAAGGDATTEIPADAGTPRSRESGVSGDERQPVVRVSGARRARLLAAPGTTAEPTPADEPERGTGARPTASGPNDDRMMRDVPPHY